LVVARRERTHAHERIGRDAELGDVLVQQGQDVQVTGRHDGSASGKHAACTGEIAGAANPDAVAVREAYLARTAVPPRASRAPSPKRSTRGVPVGRVARS